MKSVIVRAREYLGHASATERGVLRFILEHSSDASRIGTHALSQRVFASPATIVRLCRKMGFESYKDYQRALACELAVRSEDEAERDCDVRPGDSLETISSKIVSLSRAALEDTRNLIDADVARRCAALLADAESLVFFGAGAGLPAAKYAFWKFIRIKRHCQACDDSGAQLALAETLREGDAAVLIGDSGEANAAVDCAKALKRNGVPMIAITRFQESALGGLADHTLYVSAAGRDSAAGGCSALPSQILILDILYAACAQAVSVDGGSAL